jgi:von Willebrand factor type A domain
LSLELVSPWAGAVAVAAAVPLAAWVVAERRGSRARAAIGLRAPRLRARIGVPLAVGLAVGLLALAATQPVLASSEQTTIRRTADVFLVLDTSRSMLAASGPREPTRFDRARAIARRIAGSDAALAVGLASFTDRVLPHLFPTTERGDFESTLGQAMGIDRPPPATRATPRGLNRASNMAVLGDLGTAGFFAPSSARRIVVVVTDGESRPLDPDVLARAFRRGKIAPVFVHVWRPGERVWTPDGVAAPDYVEDPASGALLARLAAGVGGRAFPESELDRAVAAIRADAGGPKLETRRETTSVRRLAPLLAAIALLPLAFVLWRRNLA